MSTSQAERIRVNGSSPYEVVIGSGLISQVPGLASNVLNSRRIAVVTDDIVSGICLDRVCSSFTEAGYEALPYVFPHGEGSKCFAVLEGILEFLAEKHFRRNDTLIALGGGVVGDITGLAAALYMRGIRVIQVPTTLLAAVDSSVGGKTAIDLKNGKNMVGAFHQPSLVVCDTDLFSKLPETIFSEGMAEVIKCALIRETPVWGWISVGTVSGHLKEIISECIRLKQDIVEQDERDEKGIRNILNVGHTFAHAVEKLSGYMISHGHAVGTGLIYEAGIAYLLGLCGADVLQGVIHADDLFHLRVNVPWNAEEIVHTMLSDKKNRDDTIVFELPCGIGDCREVKLEQGKATDLIRDIIGGGII